MTTTKKIVLGAVLLFGLAVAGFFLQRLPDTGPAGPQTMWQALQHMLQRQDTATLRRIDQARDSLVLAIATIDSMFRYRDDSTAHELVRTQRQLTQTKQHVHQLQTALAEAATNTPSDSLEIYRNLDNAQRLQITQLEATVVLLMADTLAKHQELARLRVSLAKALMVAGEYRQTGTYNKWLVMGTVAAATFAGCKLLPGEHNPC